MDPLDSYGILMEFTQAMKIPFSFKVTIKSFVLDFPIIIFNFDIHGPPPTSMGPLDSYGIHLSHGNPSQFQSNNNRIHA